MKAHILFVADGRSPTTRSWISQVQSLNYTTSLISTYPCQPLENLAKFKVLPIAFSLFSQASFQGQTSRKMNKVMDLRSRLTPILQFLRYRFGPLSIFLNQNKFQELVISIQPDIIHALRIPFEGMLASFTPRPIPLLVSTWGNDLTLHAKKGWFMGQLTRRCLTRADGMLSDTQRDARLAMDWGLQPNHPILVTVGSGGLDLEAIQRAQGFSPHEYGIPENAVWVVNPRGLRPGSVHQEVFFVAIPKVHEKHPGTCFLCPNLQGVTQAQEWIQKYGLDQRTFLLPKLPQVQLWALFKQSKLFVSPCSHDGTPNALLEAMACGCFPILGDIASMREWIDDCENGFLVDPRNPKVLADAICKALDYPELIAEAVHKNLAIIKTRAADHETLPRIDQFYSQFQKL